MKFDADEVKALYKKSWADHAPGPAVVLESEEGQRVRHEKLAEIRRDDAPSVSVLDLGCGLGALYDTLKRRWPGTMIRYHGVDIVEEFIDYAGKMHKDAQFSCVNVFDQEFNHEFDYTIISGVFNNSIIDGEFLRKAVSWSFERSRIGIGFDFISSYANFVDERMSYFDPVDLLRWVIESLSRKVRLEHHFFRVNTAIFVYR